MANATLSPPQLDPMGATFSSSDLPKKPTSSLTDLHEELLATVLGFMAPRDIEALTVASKVVAREVLPRFPIWRDLFCYRWSMLNFELERGGDDHSVDIELDERLKALAPGCSESRLYQLLAHAVTPVPSFADIRQTQRAQYFSNHDHVIEAIGNPPRRRTLDITFTGRYLGGDRCVRSNAPFAPTFRVAVYAVAGGHRRKRYRVGLASSGYFEITISKPTKPAPTQGRMGRFHQIWRHASEDTTAIGLAMSSFPLIDKMPGWDAQSVGYHGDDGHFFHRTDRGRPFSEPFGVGDTIGCGIRRDLQSSRSFAYFTNNGAVIPNGNLPNECPHTFWYPVVGLDSHNVVHYNFGQDPFACAEAVDALFAESDGQFDLLATHLSWYDIAESDAESTGDEYIDTSTSEVGDSDEGDSDLGYDRLSDMSDIVEFMNGLVENE